MSEGAFLREERRAGRLNGRDRAERGNCPRASVIARRRMEER